MLQKWLLRCALNYRDTESNHMLITITQKLQAAQRLAPGKVHLALSLVGYPQEVANAMTYVFGETLICDDAESAKLVTFAPQVGAKSVTLDGDVYDPSGTLSGGSAPSSNGVLVKVQEILEVEGRLGEARGRLEVLERNYETEREGRERWKKMAKELDIKEHEMKLLEEQVGGSNAARVGSLLLESENGPLTLFTRSVPKSKP